MQLQRRGAEEERRDRERHRAHRDRGCAGGCEEALRSRWRGNGAVLPVGAIGKEPLVALVEPETSQHEVEGKLALQGGAAAEEAGGRLLEQKGCSAMDLLRVFEGGGREQP